MTSLPLVWFTGGARRLNYTTVGLIQYLAPSLQFLLAVLLYREPFGAGQLVTFGCIWVGLALFMTDALRVQRKHGSGPR